jgi:diadenosine tetraphosphate (Ap4A) HIT family hydrolase
MSSQQAQNEDSWQDLRDGVGCYLCTPRQPNNEHRLEVARLSISTLYLYGDQRFRGYCLLIFDARHAVALEDLSSVEYEHFTDDLRLSASALRRAFRPDHMNYECLGNSTPHLHWHIVPRYKDDPRWGQPIWEGWPRAEFSVNRHRVSEQEYEAMIHSIRSCLNELTPAG